MDKREARKAEAAKHISLMKVAFGAETEKSIQETREYQDGEGRALEVPEPRFETTQTDVFTYLLPQVARQAKGQVAVVDPAAFTRPGGAYEDGSFGPEQQLCAESNLYPILRAFSKTYYETNRQERRGGLLSGHALYIPGVKFVRNGEIREAGVVVIAAPNRTRALEANRSEKECASDMKDRMETLLRVAAANGADSLVVNGFGCGVDGYDPTEVAGLFRDWIDEHPGVFEHVLFSTRRGAEYDAFAVRFAQSAVKEPAEAANRDDGEEDVLDGIELPEGVTLRR